MIVFLGCLGVASAMVISSIVGGWALSVMWGWFVVPLFGLPALSIPYAIGLSLTLNYLIANSDDKRNKDEDRTEAALYAIIIAFVRPLLVLFFGWIVWQFV